MKTISKYLVVLVALMGFGLTVSTFDAQANTVTKTKAQKVSVCKVGKVKHKGHLVKLRHHTVTKTSKVKSGTV